MPQMSASLCLAFVFLPGSSSGISAPNMLACRLPAQPISSSKTRHDRSMEGCCPEEGPRGGEIPQSSQAPPPLSHWLPGERSVWASLAACAPCPSLS